MKTQERPTSRPLTGSAQTVESVAEPRASRTASLGMLFAPPSVVFVGLLLLLPLVALIWRTAESGVFLASIRKPIVVQALRLTSWTSLVTLILSVALGTPLAYTLARARFPGKRIIDTLVDLPIVLPPVVAG